MITPEALQLLLDELARLREEAAVRSAELVEVKAQRDELLKVVQELTLELKLQRERVDAMTRKLYGTSSESVDPGQLEFDLKGEDGPKPEAPASSVPGSDAADGVAPSDASPGARPAVKPKKRRSFEDLIAGLPVKRIVIDPAEVMANPKAYRCMGEEITRLADIIPNSFQCLQIVRRKWALIEDRQAAPLLAPLCTLQERCIASPALLADVLTKRFELHLPYYRIEAEYARLGLPIPRKTLCGWAGMASSACERIHAAIAEQVWADGYVQVDETPVRYQDPEVKGKCALGYLWVVHNPQRHMSVFYWRTGRGVKELKTIVPKHWEGTLQSDGYVVYESYARQARTEGRDLRQGSCMSHARRMFHPKRLDNEDAKWVLAKMQKLYRIEEGLRQARAGPEQRLETRQAESAPIMELIKKRLDHLQQTRQYLPKSNMGKAVNYALGQWGGLCAYLADGRMEIDNNLVENAIRPSAIGKKNYLFMGDPTTGERAAVFYTLISGCQRAGVNAREYLTDIFEQLPRPTTTTQTVKKLIPSVWAAAKKAASAVIHALVGTA